MISGSSVDICDAEGNIIPEMMPDLTHPNLFGYEVWGSAMDQTVRELLAE